MRFRTITILFVACLLPAILFSCTTETSPESTQPATPIITIDGIELIDDLGKEIEFITPPTKIVALGPSITESLFAIGAGDQIIGRDDLSTYPPEAENIPSIGSLWGGLPTEAILVLEPDLVIAPEIITPEQVASLEELGLTVFYLKNPRTFEELFDDLQILAQLTGHITEGEELVNQMRARLTDIVMKVALSSYKPSVFYELDATDPQNPYTVGRGTFIDHIITTAGGMNIGQVLDGEYAQISSEAVIQENPEVILLADAMYGVTIESVGERPGWSGISAVKNNKIYSVDPFLLSVPGPRLLDGLEEIARIFHPQRFK